MNKGGCLKIETKEPHDINCMLFLTTVWNFLKILRSKYMGLCQFEQVLYTNEYTYKKLLVGVLLLVHELYSKNLSSQAWKLGDIKSPSQQNDGG